MSDPLESVYQESKNESVKNEDLIRGIHISEKQIPHGIYETNTPQNRRPYSPTASDMNFEC